MHNADLSKYMCVPGKDVFYIPNFVTPEEEEYLIRKISEYPQHKWKKLSNRRLQIWGGEITAKGLLISENLPHFLMDYPGIISRIQSTGAFNSSPHGVPNHVILNEYLPGQGIMPHEDGPSYYPVVATLSLGSHSVFHYYQYKADDDMQVTSSASHGKGKVIDTTPIMSVLLERRSLIISSGSMYTDHLHGIEGVLEDRVMLQGRAVETPEQTDIAMIVCNGDMLGDTEIKHDGKEKVLKRGVRYSLTCRDVGRVMTASSPLWRPGWK